MDENDVKEEDSEFEVIEDSEASAPDLVVKLKKVKEELKKCEQERKEYLDGWQRAKADYINYKKDEGKRFEDLAKFVVGSLIQELFPVLDSFELALLHGTAQETEKGVLLIRSQLMDVLKKRGMEEIAVKPGDEFNPEKHESIGEVESDVSAGKVAEVVQKGYALAGRVIRPARVRLAKGVDDLK